MQTNVNLINKYYLLLIIDVLFIRSIIPVNITYMWNFGSLLGIALIYQIISGIFLAFHYIPTTKDAFNSVQKIMIEENYGYLLRYSHSNGASIFFILVYMHISRTLFYESYRAPRILVYYIGIVIYILMMLTAFLGYVLVWGSMSLWGAIVITNFLTILPWIGIIMLLLIWGGFSVDLPTLERFYVLHFSIPWIILLLTLVHIFSLHYKGSNNDIAINIPVFNKYFHPLFTYKDLNTILLIIMLYLYLIGYYPNYLAHPDNYIKANPMVTPSSIVPEWYFLPFYAILRSFPNKVIGVLLMAISIMILFILPVVITSNNRGNNFKWILKILFMLFVIDFISLLIIGNLPVQYPFIEIGSYLTYIYFISISILPGILSDINNYLSNYYYIINAEIKIDE